MQSTDDPPTNDEPLTTAEAGVMALVQQLTELRMRLGFDPDGSDTVGRFRGILGEHLQLGKVIASPGQNWDPGAAAAIRTLIERMRRAGPMLARIARLNGRW